jgi:tetratricopeptide (TPR) repeat protein
MLLELNNKNKAISILSTSVKEFETNNPSEEKLSNHLRLFGTVLTLLEHSDRADAKFNQAIKVDEQQIKSTPDQETKAKLLWSIAKTLAAKADISAAIDKAQQAKSVSNSAQMHQHLDEWIKDLREMNRHQYPL